TLTLTVTVDRLVLVAHPKERSLQNIQSACEHQILKIGQKVGHKEVTDVKPVGVGIGCDDDLAVPEPFYPVLNLQGYDHIIELGILCDCGLLLAIDSY